ncbi:MAG TPA: hypothetical protein VEB22_05910 [Phycisphaerales bacterium]|nr:hypothetical protein [Phycisphaerales bacterium]
MSPRDKPRAGGLVVSMRVGESVFVGTAKITLIKRRKGDVGGLQLLIKAPKDVLVVMPHHRAAAKEGDE